MRYFAVPFALVAALSAGPAMAALQAGAKAPEIVTQVALAGNAAPFDLKAALHNGPVVLYFYPKAFTQGCTLEAHAFSEATAEFRKAGATVIGMSADNIDTLKKFSVEHCRGQFAVGVASPQTIAAYDVDFQHEGQSTGLSNRTSYVIGRDGRIVLAYSDLDYKGHVAKTLAAVQGLKGGK